MKHAFFLSAREIVKYFTQLLSPFGSSKNRVKGIKKSGPMDRDAGSLDRSLGLFG